MFDVISNQKSFLAEFLAKNKLGKGKKVFLRVAFSEVFFYIKNRIKSLFIVYYGGKFTDYKDKFSLEDRE